MKTIGIIGGSGLYLLEEFEYVKSHKLSTPWGKPSDEITEYSFCNNKIYFLPRHHKNHSITPTRINSKANIDAFKQVGVTDVLSISAVGSLNEKLSPGTFVIIDQYIDQSNRKGETFFDEGIVVHVSMAHPTDKNLMEIAKHTLESLNIKFNYGGTYLGISGPQFSTLAESNLYRSWKCDVIGMTNLPEVNLCREADLRYLSIGMVTDYDCWNEKYSNVEVKNALDILESNIKNSNIMLVHFLKRYFKTKLNDNLNVYKSIVTPLNKIDKKTICRLKNIIPQLYIANN